MFEIFTQILLKLLQDPELMPLDELDGSESEGDEDMFVGDAGPAGRAFVQS